MLRVFKCTLVFHTQSVKKQCYVVATCGYHSSNTVTNRPIIKSAKVNEVNSTYQSVADFYAGKSVFLTGGTGFLGKVFIEQLLSKCSQIDKIYVLIRARKDAPAQQRLHELFQTPIFNKVRSTTPERLNKVVPIAGDLTQPDMGIKPEDEQTLIDKVSIVINSAAAVKFTEPFKNILAVNVEGTRKVMSLAQRMKNMEIFVHLSTAFANTDRLIVDEIVYPPPRTLDEVNEFVKRKHDEEETAKFLRGHANPYTFSKSLTENLVLESKGNLPTIMVRPSIVCPVYREPEPGWLDTWIAGTGTFSDVARGLTRVIYGSKDVVSDLIPVDYVCNFTIAAAAKCPKTTELSVYNICTSSTNPITWVSAAKLFAKHSKKFGYNDLPWPTVVASNSPLMVLTLTFLMQTIPTFVTDLWLRATGRKAKYMKLQPRAVLLRDLVRDFSSSNFVFKSDRAQELISSLDEKDYRRFMCDPKTIDWNEYMPTYCYGVKKYLLNK